MSLNPQAEVDVDRLKKVGQELSEHFDSVRIFVTRCEGTAEGTMNATWGEGNYFASKGYISEWMIRQDEEIRVNIRNDNDHP